MGEVMGKIEKNAELLRVYAANVQHGLMDVASIVEEPANQALRLTCFAAMTPIIGAMLAVEGRQKVSDNQLREIYSGFVHLLVEHSQPLDSRN
jgi:hypothetical protein